MASKHNHCYPHHTLLVKKFKKLLLLENDTRTILKYTEACSVKNSWLKKHSRNSSVLHLENPD